MKKLKLTFIIAMCFISYFPVQTETNVMNKSDRFLYQETDNIEVLYGG